MKLDIWLLDKLDSLTTKLQRKGYLLTSIHVHVSGVIFASAILSCFLKGQFVWMVVVGGVFGLILFGINIWAQNHKDYPSSVKMMEKLNAKVLYNRENRSLYRWIWLAFIVTLWPLDLVDVFSGNISKGIMSSICLFSMVLSCFLDGCFFIGPGEFAKETQSQDVKDDVHNSI